MKRSHIPAAAAAITAALFLAALFLTLPHEPALPLVVIVYNGEKGDLSYIDSAYRGLFAAQEAMPFAKREFTALDQEKIFPLSGENGAAEPGLVITVSYTYTNGTRQLALDHPDVRFLAIDQKGPGLPNLRTYEITSYGGSYLAGVLAATATKTRHIGIILGTQSGLLDGFRLGYRDGARAADPSIAIDEQYVRDNSTAGFSDPDRAGLIAREMYRDGADVIYTVAGFSGTGAIAEAKRAPGRFIIGVDADQTDLGPSVVLASAVKRLDRVVCTGIGDYLNGSFTGGEQVAGLEEGATGLVFNPKFAMYNETVSDWAGKAEEEEARYLAQRR